MSPLKCFAGEISIQMGKYGIKKKKRWASSRRSGYNKFPPGKKKKKNERWVDFSVQPARTTGGRLNDYVTSRSGISKNNNHRLGRILWPSKIKGEWERDRLGGGQMLWRLSGAACLWLCCRVSRVGQLALEFIHPLYELTEREISSLHVQAECDTSINEPKFQPQMTTLPLNIQCCTSGDQRKTSSVLWPVKG